MDQQEFGDLKMSFLKRITRDFFHLVYSSCFFSVWLRTGSSQDGGSPSGGLK